MKFKKAVLTAGAIGALGVAGSFGTFAAFTDELPAQETQFKTGTVKVTGGFEMPDLSSMGTQEPARAGKIRVTNTGTEPVHVYMDWDGPVGNLKQDGTSGPYFSDNLLAENISVDTSYDANFSTLMDDRTRLWMLNRRDFSPFLASLTAPYPKLVLQPGQAQDLYFRARLRERLPDGWTNPAGDDNEMAGKAINETIRIKAIEAGSSTKGLGITDANGDGFADGYDNGQ